MDILFLIYIWYNTQNAKLISLFLFCYDNLVLHWKAKWKTKNFFISCESHVNFCNITKGRSRKVVFHTAFFFSALLMRFLVFVNTSTALLLKVESLSLGNRRLMASEILKVTKDVKCEVLYVGPRHVHTYFLCTGINQAHWRTPFFLFPCHRKCMISITPDQLRVWLY